MTSPLPKPIQGFPCEKPLPQRSVPARPPPVAVYCYCNSHAYSPRVEHYKQLEIKEKKLLQEYDDVRQTMVSVCNDILDHPCDDLETKMETMYEITFNARSRPLSTYRPLRADKFGKAPIPMTPHKLGILDRYQDPTTFPELLPIVRPTINPPGAITTLVVPKSIMAYYADHPGRTEYQDGISRSAKAFLAAVHRYKEPMPSTRRRADDPNL